MTAETTMLDVDRDRLSRPELRFADILGEELAAKELHERASRIGVEAVERALQPPPVAQRNR